MRFAKPHFHLSTFIYVPVFLLSAYLVLFQSYAVLKTITILCFIWLIALLIIAFGGLGTKTIGEKSEQSIVNKQFLFSFQTIQFQLLTFIAIIGGLLAFHSFISPQIIIFPRIYAFYFFFSWVIYLLCAAAYACFKSEEKLSFINQCLIPLFEITFFKKHEVTIKVTNNTYFSQANFVWFSASFAILLFAISHYLSIFFHTHLVSNFTIRNVLIASLLFMILNAKGWVNFVRENAYEKNFLTIFVSVAALLIIVTNVLSWLFYYVSTFFHFSNFIIPFSIHDWFAWLDSITLNQIFIWSWLLGFGPFVALKTVNIYKGKSIRKMISESLILPSLISLMIFFAPNFTAAAANLVKQIVVLLFLVLSFGIILFAFLKEESFQKVFFSKVTAKSTDALQNVVQSTKGIFQNIIALFILVLLFGLLIIAIIVSTLFFPILLLTLLLCAAIFYATRKLQFQKS